MQQVRFQFPDGLGQCYLLPQRISRAAKLNDMEVFRFFQAPVLPRSNEYVIFITVFPLLQFFQCLQDDKVHAMLVFAENALGFDGDSHFAAFLFFFRLKILVMWLMEEVTTNMGRDQKALRNLRLISPSGMAIKKVMNKTAKSAYHFVASGHSRNVIATAHIVIYKMSRKRDGSSHWNNFSHKSHFPCKNAIGNCCNASMEHVLLGLFHILIRLHD